MRVRSLSPPTFPSLASLSAIWITSLGATLSLSHHGLTPAHNRGSRAKSATPLPLRPTTAYQTLAPSSLSSCPRRTIPSS